MVNGLFERSMKKPLHCLLLIIDAMKIINELHGGFKFLVQYWLNNCHEFQNQQYPSIQCQFSIISIFLGQNHNIFCVMLDSLSKGYFLDILNNSLCRQVFHTISPSSSKCVLFVKYLAKIYKTGIIAQGFIVQISMTNFLEIQSPKRDICYKKHEISKKNQILCTFVAFFWFKYQKLANITASLYFVKKWIFLY